MLFYTNRHFLLSLISILFLASCSKKALTDLAASDGQNQQDSSNSGGQDGNLSSSINEVNSANRNTYLANFDSSFNNVNGKILAYNADTALFSDMTPTGSNLPLTYNEPGSATFSYVNLKTGVFHGSIEKKGTYLFQQNQSQYEMMFFKYSDNSLTAMNVFAGSADPYVAYSSNFAMITNQADSANYIVSPTQAQAVNTLLGLDTNVENLNGAMFLPLGKGYFAAFSQISGQSLPSKLMTFSAESPHQIQRQTTDHQYLFFGGYSEQSAYFGSANANYDFDFYFIRYSDGQLTKVLSTLNTQYQMAFSFQDEYSHYYLFMKDLTNSLFIVKKINAFTGEISQVASQPVASSLINDCDGNSFKVEKNIYNSKIYLSCEVNALDGNNNAIKNAVAIIVNLQSGVLTDQIVMTDIDSEKTYFFSYKGELYIQKNVKQHAVINTTTEQVGTINDNQLHTDIREYCVAELAGYNCNQIYIASSSSNTRNLYANPMNEEDLRFFFVGINDGNNVSQSFLFVLSDTGVDSRITISTFADMFFSLMRIFVRNISVPMFASLGN